MVFSDYICLKTDKDTSRHSIYPAFGHMEYIAAGLNDSHSGLQMKSPTAKTSKSI